MEIYSLKTTIYSNPVCVLLYFQTSKIILEFRYSYKKNLENEIDHIDELKLF